MYHLALLLAVASATAVAGFYQAHQMEMGAFLELRKDGRFRYQLDYGAVSEAAEGAWTFDGKTVRLTTRPRPNPPSFELVRDDPAPPGELSITIEPPGFGADGYRLDAIATDSATGERGMVTSDADGHVESGGRTLSTIEPLVPVFGLSGGRFALSPDRGHRLLLRFHANDLGRASFEGEPLQLATGALVLNRYETQIRFIRMSH